MAKAHLTITETPLLPGSLVDTLCGSAIFPAQIVCMWDTVAMNSPLGFNALLCCKKCWDAIHSCESQRYIYGVIKEQDLKVEAEP